MTATGKKIHYQLREQAVRDAADGLLRASVSIPAPRLAATRWSRGSARITPLGRNAPGTWEGLVDGRSGISPITSFDASALPIRIAGEIHDFDAEAACSAPSAPAARPASPSWRSSPPARPSPTPAWTSTVAPDRIGVIVNSACAGTPETERNVRSAGHRGPRGRQPVLRPVDDPQHGRLRGRHRPQAARPGQRQRAGLRQRHRGAAGGPALILSGEADVVIAGGTDAAINEAMFAGLSMMGPLSERNDEPGARPAARSTLDRDGFVFGEGAVVLRRRVRRARRRPGRRDLRHDRRRRADQRRLSHQRPRAHRSHAARAISLALATAGVAPRRARLHLRSRHRHPANDAAETRAIQIALGDEADGVPASSPKSMVGHLIGAAGALSVMACLLAMRDGVLPPTTNLHTPDPECDLDYVPLTARARPRSAPPPPTRSASAARTASSSCGRRARPLPRPRPGRPARRPPPPRSAPAVGGWEAISRVSHLGGSRSATFCSAIARSKEMNASGAPRAELQRELVGPALDARATGALAIGPAERRPPPRRAPAPGVPPASRAPATAPSSPAAPPGQPRRDQRGERDVARDVTVAHVAELVGDDQADLLAGVAIEQRVEEHDPLGRPQTGDVGVGGGRTTAGVDRVHLPDVTPRRPRRQRQHVGRGSRPRAAG